MLDLTEFQRGLIVGARLAGASVSKTAVLFGVSRSTVSRVMTAFTKDGRTKPARTNCGRKTMFTESDRETLLKIVAKKPKITAEQITAEVNTYLNNPVSIKTVRRELHKQNIYGRAVISKSLVSDVNSTNGNDVVKNES